MKPLLSVNVSATYKPFKHLFPSILVVVVAIAAYMVSAPTYKAPTVLGSGSTVAVGGSGGIGGAGGAGGTAIGGNGDCRDKCSGGDASANGGHGGNASGGNGVIVNRP
ncbi:MAG: hypothetical protein WBZ36_00735 [Candidatus Nitrosopolaris sp.]